ncbi:hypothetical protein F4777DRAFT_162342 [Nemania sp. FL0916]|nr:hypothetical protein F4777DRAFT_162342 [Nemania sp. FL0916]
MTMPSSTDPFRYTSYDQGTIIAVIITLTALAFLIVCVRVAGKLSIHQFELDDALVCISMLLSLLEAVATYMFIKVDFVNIRPQNIPLYDYMVPLMWNYAIEILYTPILALVKTSILLLLLRLFGEKRGVRRFIIGVNVANLGMMVIIFIGAVLQCIPLNKIWQPELKGKCINKKILFAVGSSFNIFTDLLILGLPLKIFICLKIPRQTKIALMIIFLLGFAATIASISRLILLLRGMFMWTLNLRQRTSCSFATAALEVNLAIITASAPALRPLFRIWFPRPSSTHRDEIAGSPRYRESRTEAAPVTRLGSPSPFPIQIPQESHEQNMAIGSFARINDNIIKNNTGLDTLRPPAPIRVPAHLKSQWPENWI